VSSRVSTAVAERSTLPARVGGEDVRLEVTEAGHETPSRAVHRSAGGGFGDVGVHPGSDAGRGDRLRVSSPGDPAERQAERVADRVVQGLPAFETTPADPGSAVGRVAADAEEGEEVGEGVIEPGEEPEDEESPAEVHASRDAGPATTPAGFGDAVAGAGRGAAIPARARATLARSFGRAFGDVRLHRGDRADELAGSIGAQAFTWGNDVYLGGTVPSLDRPEGLRVVAHELAHVCQQSSTPRTRTVHRSDALYVSTRLLRCRDPLPPRARMAHACARLIGRGAGRRPDRQARRPEQGAAGLARGPGRDLPPPAPGRVHVALRTGPDPADPGRVGG